MGRPVPVDDPFWSLLVRDAQGWGMTARDFAAVMMAESGIDPSAFNPSGSGAAGINQITNPKNYAPLTRDAYLALDASAQWELAAKKFFDGVIRSNPGVKEGGARDLYWVNFAPATYKPNTPDDAIIIRPGVNYGTSSSPMMGEWMIRDNPGFVLPADKASPVIRPAGLTAFIAKNFTSKRWHDVLGAIGEAEKGNGIAWNPPATRPTLPSVGPKPLPPPRAAEASMMGPALVLGLLAFVGWRSRKLRRRV